MRETNQQIPLTAEVDKKRSPKWRRLAASAGCLAVLAPVGSHLADRPLRGVYECSISPDPDYRHDPDKLTPDFGNRSIRIGQSKLYNQTGIIDLMRPSGNGEMQPYNNLILEAKRGFILCGSEMADADVQVHERAIDRPGQTVAFRYDKLPNGVGLNLLVHTPPTDSEMALQIQLRRGSRLPELLRLNNSFGLLEQIDMIKLGDTVTHAGDVTDVGGGYLESGHHQRYPVPDDSTVYFGGHSGWVYYQQIDTPDENNLQYVYTERRQTPWLDWMQPLAAPLQGQAWFEGISIAVSVPSRTMLDDTTWTMGYFYDPEFFDGESSEQPVLASDSEGEAVEAY